MQLAAKNTAHQVCRAWYRAWRYAHKDKTIVLRDNADALLRLWRSMGVIEWIRRVSFDQYECRYLLPALEGLTALRTLELPWSAVTASSGVVPWSALMALRDLVILDTRKLRLGCGQNLINLGLAADRQLPWSRLTSLRVHGHPQINSWACLGGATALRSFHGDDTHSLYNILRHLKATPLLHLTSIEIRGLTTRP